MKVFDSIQVQTPSKNVFNLSHDVKASYNFDKIYPFFCRSILPGETWNIRSEVFMRAMPLLAPVMHNVDMFIYYVFVPDRLVFNADKKHDFRIFITGGEDGLQEAALPTWNYAQVANVDPDLVRHGSLLDHMGFPSLDKNKTVHSSKVSQKISALPFRAYQFVYNEMFRNQNVQNEIEFSYDQGDIDDTDVSALFSFRKKCWEKDYFTSCLPWAQRGEAVLLPVEATVTPGSATVFAPVSVNSAKYAGDTVAYGLTSLGGGDAAVGTSNTTPPTNRTAISLEGTARIDATEVVRFSGLSIGTINDFRYCLRLQQWLEINARSGSRYIEQIFAHFGVKSSDARLQRPELLGGGKVPLIFSDIPQTSYGDGDDRDVLGDLGGKGTLYGKTQGFKAYFEEHGILLGLLTIIPRTSYSQGIPREWTLLDKTDWYWPQFAHLGEQAVLNKEIYFDPSQAPSSDPELDDDGVFGYQGRYTEYRYIPSSFHGEMRSDLAYWHMGRIFSALPRLNSDFVTAQSSPRCFALADVAAANYDPFVCQLHLDIKAVRPLPKYATPTL